jgi:hypothetical protein
MGCSAEPNTSDFRKKLNEGKCLKSIENSKKNENDENKKNNIENIENSVNNSKNRKNKENSEIENEDDDKENEEKMKNNLDNLFKSYYIAKTYFCENEFKEKEVDAIRKCKKIIEAKELLEQGLFKKIKEKELPKEITPEYITGYTEEERNKKINDIINILNKEKEELKKNLDNKINELKNNVDKIKKENMEKYKEASKIILDKEKNKINEITKIIQLVKETLKDKYIPVPDYIIAYEECKREKINDDIPENVIRISVGNLTYKKSNPLIILIIDEKNINLKKEIKTDINETFDWTLDEKQFKILFKCRINVVLERTYAIKKNKLKGTSEVSLRKLEEFDSFNGSYNIKMESGKSDSKIDIAVQLRSPILNKTYETIYKEVLKIKKIYPKFNANFV